MSCDVFIQLREWDTPLWHCEVIWIRSSNHSGRSFESVIRDDLKLYDHGRCDFIFFVNSRAFRVLGYDDVDRTRSTVSGTPRAHAR